jgi:hypothetical protein
VHVNIAIIQDRPTCGIGWQACIDMVMKTVEEGRSAKPDYIHFSNDDIVVAEGWLEPLVEAVEAGYLGCPRMEPAGYHMGQEPAVDMAPAEAPPRSDRSYWYADLPEKQPQFGLGDSRSRVAAVLLTGAVGTGQAVPADPLRDRQVVLLQGASPGHSSGRADEVRDLQLRGPGRSGQGGVGGA